MAGANDTHRTASPPPPPWPRTVVVAVVGAYRQSMGEQPWSTVADRAARGAFLAAGGDPERAAHDIPLILSTAARGHSAWFWRPARARIEREERWWKERGIWPPMRRRDRPEIG